MNEDDLQYLEDNTSSILKCARVDLLPEEEVDEEFAYSLIEIFENQDFLDK